MGYPNGPEFEWFKRRLENRYRIVTVGLLEIRSYELWFKPRPNVPYLSPEAYSLIGLSVVGKLVVYKRV